MYAHQMSIASGSAAPGGGDYERSGDYQYELDARTIVALMWMRLIHSGSIIVATSTQLPAFDNLWRTMNRKKLITFVVLILSLGDLPVQAEGAANPVTDLLAKMQSANDAAAKEDLAKQIAGLPPSTGVAAILMEALEKRRGLGCGETARAIRVFISERPDAAAQFAAPLLKAAKSDHSFPETCYFALPQVIKSVGKTRGPDALPALIAILHDPPKTPNGVPSDEVSKTLGFALAELGPDIVTQLWDRRNEWGQFGSLSLIVALYETTKRNPDLRSDAVKRLLSEMMPPTVEREAIVIAAASALKEFQNPAVAAAMIPALQSEDRPVVTRVATDIFGISDEARAAVLDAFRREKTTAAIASALSAVARLKSPGWEIAVEVLNAALASNNLVAGNGAYWYFLSERRVDAIDYLKAVLSAHGGREMAEDMLNSGNRSLSDAAKAWARDHDYRIETTPRFTNAKPWGN
jgi:hypothetical protein